MTNRPSVALSRSSRTKDVKNGNSHEKLKVLGGLSDFFRNVPSFYLSAVRVVCVKNLQNCPQFTVLPLEMFRHHT